MRTIVLYGNSLAVSSVGASLRDCEGLRLVSVRAVLPDAFHELIKLRPDVVIFDLTATQPNFALALLQARPGLLLVGVDLKTDKALVLSGQTSHVLTTEDLLRVIGSPSDSAAKEQA